MHYSSNKTPFPLFFVAVQKISIYMHQPATTWKSAALTRERYAGRRIYAAAPSLTRRASHRLDRKQSGSIPEGKRKRSGSAFSRTKPRLAVQSASGREKNPRGVVRRSPDPALASDRRSPKGCAQHAIFESRRLAPRDAMPFAERKVYIGFAQVRIFEIFATFGQKCSKMQHRESPEEKIVREAHSSKPSRNHREKRMLFASIAPSLPGLGDYTRSRGATAIRYIGRSAQTEPWLSHEEYT
jgi:hypothetical protein